mmetsp:Transcript_3044/g.8381  ORF Transcript_3044/g.8381 Transcript_3044/m.8381 type:complete len:241 (+) Transcript_3044:370-1092(+)
MAARQLVELRAVKAEGMGDSPVPDQGHQDGIEIDKELGGLGRVGLFLVGLGLLVDLDASLLIGGALLNGNPLRLLRHQGTVRHGPQDTGFQRIHRRSRHGGFPRSDIAVSRGELSVLLLMLLLLLLLLVLLAGQRQNGDQFPAEAGVVRGDARIQFLEFPTGGFGIAGELVVRVQGIFAVVEIVGLEAKSERGYRREILLCGGLPGAQQGGGSGKEERRLRKNHGSFLAFVCVCFWLVSL